MSIEQRFAARFPGSARLAAEARATFPGGVTHDGRTAAPYPLFIERSSGAYKWDVDDNRMIDYVCGHGALLLGHGHPAVVAAVQAQMERGTHYGAEHALALRWAGLVQELVPGAERVRFTSSGTEATMLALRLARAFTGRPKVIRLQGHFHGWHDGISPGADPDDPNAGLPTDLVGNLIVLPADLDAIAETLARRDDIAAVILEPTGAAYGTQPLPASFLPAVRALTAERDTLLICDEVVTGFRLAPGGAQARAGVMADLTCLAKVLAGGLPGGAIAGREALLARLAASAAEGPRGRVRHQGTYNANPLSAAAGVAALELVAGGAPVEAANARGNELRAALNAVFAARGLRGFSAYGDGSIIHLFADPASDLAPGAPPAGVPMAALKAGGSPKLVAALRMALQLEGVDLMRGRSAFVSAAHSPADISATADALGAALDTLSAEGMI